MKTTKMHADPGKQEVVFTHTFDAPRAAVFKAFTDAKLIPHWWGPKEYSTSIEKMDLKPGGEWRYIQKDPKGNEYGFHGVYHTIVPNEKLVHTFEYEGMPGHVLLETVVFEDHNGKTTLIDQSVYQSVADRDGMINTGMENGMVESMERLAEILAQD